MRVFLALPVKNIFAELASESSSEQVSLLWQNSSVTIERIVSHSHASPPGFWYDLNEDEWVMVLRGGAALELAGGEVVRLNAGDYVLIPRHERHRVAETSAQTVWLAVHVK